MLSPLYWILIKSWIKYAFHVIASWSWVSHWRWAKVLRPAQDGHETWSEAARGGAGVWPSQLLRWSWRLWGDAIGEHVIMCHRTAVGTGSPESPCAHHTLHVLVTTWWGRWWLWPIYSYRNWSSEKWWNFPKMMQVVSSRVEILMHLMGSYLLFNTAYWGRRERLENFFFLKFLYWAEVSCTLHWGREMRVLPGVHTSQALSASLCRRQGRPPGETSTSISLCL